MAGKSHKETAADNTRAYHERMKNKIIPMNVDEKGRYLTWKWDIEHGTKLCKDKMEQYNKLHSIYGGLKNGNV